MQQHNDPQAQQKIYNRLTEKEKNQGVTMAQSISELQMLLHALFKKINKLEFVTRQLFDLNLPLSSQAMTQSAEMRRMMVLSE